jgi:hypothetical protein
MNEQLRYFARDALKKGLAQLSDAQLILFKRIYSHKDTNRPIDDIIDTMPEGQLDWAMQQVQRTLLRII